MSYTVGSEPLAEVDLKIRQGSTTTVALSYTATDAAGAPVATDFTGWTARSQIRAQVGGTVWASLTTGSGITLAATSTTLTVTLTLPAATTEATAWNSYGVGVWDVELVRVDGTVIPFVAGKVFVSHDVTR